MSTITVVGTGYVGLTTGAYLAHLGHDVTCTDIDTQKIRDLDGGLITSVEPGLDDLVAAGRREDRLRFRENVVDASANAEFVFLAVPTPQNDDGTADVSFVLQAASQISPVLQAQAHVVIKSTVPVGTATRVEEALGRADVFVVSNPEFLREGSAVSDCLHPDRIVIGARHQEAAARVGELFQKLHAPVILTDPASAETIKYASNAFLATKVSFINAMANICEAVGADVREVALGMGYDKRIGFDFLKPGPGWGGSCFPKDSRALVAIADDAGYDFALLKGAIAVNDAQREQTVRKVREAAGGSLHGRVVAVWGLSFKANTDDLRDSPALAIIDQMLDEGASVKAYDITQSRPHAPHHPTLDGIEVCMDPYGAVDGADVLVILTEWDEFRWLDFAKVNELLRQPTVVDARNLLDEAKLRRLGFQFRAVGRL